MGQKMGYLVDLNTVQFDEESSSSWIMAMPLGTYDHPVYGEIEFTPKKIAQFAENVNNGVRGTELDIDYDHKATGGEAAGWVKKAEARPDGLWLFVEWTKKAYESIKSKAYRYFSPEFDDTWTHPKTKTEYKNVLFGGGITNRPFLKDILPLNLSEAFALADGNNTGKGASSMDPEQLKAVAKLLGLPDDATGDQILGALQVKLGVPGNEDPEDPNDPDAGGGDDPEKKKEEMSEQRQSLPPELNDVAAIKKLAESNPVVKQLMDIVEAQGSQLTKNSKQLKEAAVSSTITKLNEKAKAKGYALPPTTTDALSETLMLTEDEKVSDSIVQAFDKLLDTGLVQMNEVGQGRQDSGEEDATKKFADAVKAKMDSDKMSYADATVAVSKEDPQLFSDYQSASYAFQV